MTKVCNHELTIYCLKISFATKLFSFTNAENIHTMKPGIEVINLFPCSTQLSTKFILLINVKMPTIVGILTIISMINTTSERHDPRNFFICRYFSFNDQLKLCAHLSWAWNKFYNLRAYASLHMFNISYISCDCKVAFPRLYCNYSTLNTWVKVQNFKKMNCKQIREAIKICLNQRKLHTMTPGFAMKWAAGSSLTGVTALCPWARHIYPSLVLVQPKRSVPT